LVQRNLLRQISLIFNLAEAFFVFSRKFAHKLVVIFHLSSFYIEVDGDDFERKISKKLPLTFFFRGGAEWVLSVDFLGMHLAVAMS